MVLQMSPRSLKSMHLTRVRFRGEIDFCRLMSDCPVLNDLSLDSVTTDRAGSKVYINGSNFEFYEDLHNLVEASLHVDYSQTDKLLRFLTSVEFLSIHLYPTTVLLLADTISQRLRHLKLSTYGKMSRNLLLHLLKHCPKLQVLKLQEIHWRIKWPVSPHTRCKAEEFKDPPPLFSNPSSVPECLSFHLKTFGWKCGRSGEKRLLRIKELESVPKASTSCQLIMRLTGGFGSVHRGTLPGGQIIAVKQYKIASTQGDKEFCSEVEVLSCAQHRNVVMLIGLCVEDGKRLLVYEYICNGSLHSHLYGLGKEPLGWSARQKIAVGAARGLRYLHEECRVGCIVHRDMRPNNILLTHDFEPLVGDFGLARWQPEGDKGVETRVIGTFGYLAPEYTQSGQITEKADVYSFGVVLVELITGRKAMDIKRPKGQQCLTEWARPLLQKQAIKELLDPRLMNCYSEQEVYCMALCAYLCIRRDPNSRPRMSQVCCHISSLKNTY
ncbi:hypothetical protein HID58_046153 [Brassica napus]|uniref:Protein kinase domain-containing protein n=1 Tax=Brassica napus TaxID=3708 RepID=A0ABQ8AVL0_BRANA|nr:hypothetical protein HID58_046153 [Brassica napus]